MTLDEWVQERIESVRQADDDALMASEAFSLGEFDAYWVACQSDLRRRIAERYGETTDPDTE